MSSAAGARSARTAVLRRRRVGAMLRNGLEPWHLLVVAIVFLLLFGSKKLPDAARGLGKSMRILKSEAKAMKEDGVAQPTAGPAQNPTATEPAPTATEPTPGVAEPAPTVVEAASAETVTARHTPAETTPAH
jgi:sec-independent protein translocase protein TatA